ncbi:hypothetical protein JCM10207_006430 [Rhodosporidiobolus poonsookiae]
MGIALWLCPASSAAETDLSSVISTLSSTHSTPLFSPHVTLISGIPSPTPLPEILSQLTTAVSSYRAAHTPPLTLTLSDLGTRAAHGNYFQFVFARVLADRPLLDLRKAVRAALFPEQVAAGEGDAYFPHLSLAYGEDAPEEGRIAVGIIEKLVKEGTAKEGEGERWSVGGVEEVEVLEVKVVRCDGKPEEWKVLGSVPL